jgi:hypothetical protein
MESKSVDGSDRWMHDLARSPFASGRGLGGFIGSLVGSVACPGWLVLYAINGNVDPGPWIAIVSAHLVTGLIIFLLITLYRWRDECRSYLRDQEAEAG